MNNKKFNKDGLNDSSKKSELSDSKITIKVDEEMLKEFDKGNAVLRIPFPDYEKKSNTGKDSSTDK